jgi:hypothetical protein
MASDPLEVDKPNPKANRPFWSDKVVWLLMVLALVGFGLYVKLDTRVFPSASIDLKYSREQIAKQSRERAEICGYKTQSTIESTTFTFFNESKTFLEYELGLDEANRLMKDKVPVWSWTTRYCKQNDLRAISCLAFAYGQAFGFHAQLRR